MKVFWVAGVVVAAMMVMAVGASSASATTTQLCEVSTSPCPMGHAYSSGTTFTVKGEFSLSGVTGCVMTYKFKAGSSGGVDVATELTGFSFSGCSHGTPSPLHFPTWSFPISVGSPPDGAGEVQSGGLGSPGFKVGSCVFENPYIPQEIFGGGAAPVIETVGGVTLTGTGTGCPSSTVLSMGGTASPDFYVTN